MARDRAWLEEDGRTVTTMQEIALAPPCDPGSSVTVIKAEDDFCTSYMYTDPDPEVGIIGAGRSLPATIKRAEEYARKLEAEARRLAYLERFEAERERIRLMGQDEIIAEGCAHPLYADRWKALCNPLVIRRHEFERIHLGTTGSKFDIRSRRIQRWLDEQNVTMTIGLVPLKVIAITRKHRSRFEVVVLQFDTAHAAFYFKVTWL